MEPFRALICVLCLLLVSGISESARRRQDGAEDGENENSACSALRSRCLCRRPRRKEQSLTCLKENCMERLPTDKIPDGQVREVVSLLVTRQDNLTRIGSEELRRLGKIRHIRIFRCRISEVAPDAFIGLNDVERLDLHRNKLTEVPTAIRFLKNLKSLNLGGNQIWYIKHGTFYPNRQLERLILGRNFLAKMPTLLPPSLVKLSLNRNALQSLDGIERLTNLKILNADGNKLTEFPSLPNSVNAIYLCSNLINQTISLGSFPNLKVVNLNYNPRIGDISLSTFHSSASRLSASKLTTFDARHSGVRSIDVDAFSCVPWLQHLDISENLISEFHEQWFVGNRGLRSVFLSGNPFQCDCDVTSSLWQVAQAFTRRRRQKELRKRSTSPKAVFSFTHDFNNVTCPHEVSESCEDFSLVTTTCPLEDSSPTSPTTTTGSTTTTTLPITTTEKEPERILDSTAQTTTVSTTTTSAEPTTKLRKTTTEKLVIPPLLGARTEKTTITSTTTTTATTTTTEATTSSTTTTPTTTATTATPTTTTPSTTTTTTSAATTTTEKAKEEWCLADGRKCHFPFLYNGRELNKCAPGYSPWCSPTYNYDEDGEWDRCQIC